MLLAAGGLAVAITGCDNFENPLTWDESPAAEDLVGSWHGIEGDEAGSVVRVTRAGDQGLRFEITYPEGTPATAWQDKNKHRAEFRANLLRSESVDILQIEASTYEEYEANGKPLDAAGSGYLFRRVTPLPDGNLSVQRLHRHLLGRVAEAELGHSGLRLDADQVTDCMSTDMQMFTLIWFLGNITERLDAETKAAVIAALFDEGDGAVEFEQVRREYDNLKVDPYRELEELRTCIARHLPGDALEQLFSAHADRVFAGGIDRYARQP